MCIRSRLLEVIVLVSMLLLSVETLSAQSPNNDHYKFEVGGPFKIGLLGAPAETTHNFEGSIGVSFRF